MKNATRALYLVAAVCALFAAAVYPTAGLYKNNAPEPSVAGTPVAPTSTSADDVTNSSTTPASTSDGVPRPPGEDLADPASNRMDLLEKIGMPTNDADAEAWANTCMAKVGSFSKCWTDLLDTVSVEDAVAVVATAVTHVTRFSSSCHMPAHLLGRRIYDEKQDPMKALLTASATCEEGLYHGVFEEWGTQTGAGIERQIGGLCQKLAGTKVEGICAHGAGHALWYGMRDVQKALQACKREKTIDLDGCASGVTMSFVQEDSVKFSSAKEVHDFCAAYPEDLRSGCIAESAGLLRRALQDMREVVKACVILEDLKGADHCTKAAGMQLVYALNLDFEEIKKTCASTKYERDCLFGAQRQLFVRPVPEATALRERICAYKPEACQGN